ncbi:NAD(P)H azoreductase [Actinomadura rubteroloni]|uniref:NAD(P)H azoreductase n=1 Tax=Actinomadura rubteroloni TaxID=1926885 RepID=A0A2P4UJD6_9ACTN|nr:NAD(P)H-binding protein [Actinomadura rubteroloni]POM25157.1 NAD(P)H azoreductase [Actinomadura rubteroloni]
MIVVTAPTSTIGRVLVDVLLEEGAELRLVARDPSRLAPEIRARTEVVEGSHGDRDVIDRACKGAEAVFWLAPDIDVPYTDFTRPGIAAFVRHGVERVVAITALGKGTRFAEHAGPVTASLAMCDLIAESGVAFRAVACPSFMHNLLNQVTSIRERGEFSMMIDPDLAAPLVAARDIAVASARLLLDDGWDGTGQVAVLGPEDLTPLDMARIMSDVLGTEIAYRQSTPGAFKASLTGFGMPDEAAQGMVDMFDAKNRGIDNAEPRTAASTTPTTFRSWCEDVLRPAVLG